MPRRDPVSPFEYVDIPTVCPPFWADLDRAIGKAFTRIFTDEELTKMNLALCIGHSPEKKYQELHGLLIVQRRKCQEASAPRMFRDVNYGLWAETEVAVFLLEQALRWPTCLNTLNEALKLSSPGERQSNFFCLRAQHFLKMGMFYLAEREAQKQVDWLKSNSDKPTLPSLAMFRVLLECAAREREMVRAQSFFNMLENLVVNMRPGPRANEESRALDVLKDRFGLKRRGDPAEPPAAEEEVEAQGPANPNPNRRV